MSLPNDPVPARHDDPLVASVLRAAGDADAAGCPDAELLGLYAERGVAAQQRARLDGHVERCARCQAIVAALMRSMPAAEESTGLSDEVRGSFAAWFAGWRWLVPAASLAAVATVAVWVGRGPSDEVAQSARVEVREPVLQRVPDLSALPPRPSAAEVDARSTAAEAELRAGRQTSARDSRRQLAPPAPAPPASASEALTMPPAAAEVPVSARPAATAAEAPVSATPAATAAAPPAPPVAARMPASPAGPAAATADASADAMRAKKEAAATEARENVTLADGARATGAAAGAGRAPMFRAAIAVPPWRSTAGVVERSRDNGRTWTPVALPGGVRALAVAAVSADVCWAIADDAVFRVLDGATWTRTARPSSGALTNISATSARDAIVTVGGVRFATADGGTTWAPVR